MLFCIQILSFIIKYCAKVVKKDAVKIILAGIETIAWSAGIKVENSHLKKMNTSLR